MGAAPPAPPLHVPVPWWITPVTKACLIGLALALMGLAYGWWRRRHRPKVSKHERSMRRWVRWVHKRWPWDAQNLGLVLVDDTTRHRRSLWTGKALPVIIHIPPIRFQAAPNGLRARMQTLPGVGLEEVTKMAGHLANAWGCHRVDVAQDGPGRLALRGFVSDPLTEPWHVTPDGRPLTGWLLHVGINDEAERVLLPLSNLSGITVAGVPGTGKTSLQRWWLCQLAPHPAVQIAVLDGKVSDPKDGDYGQLLGRCFAATGDDLADANQLLAELWQDMRDRSAWLRTHRATAQFWEHGPRSDCPLVVVVVDLCRWRDYADSRGVVSL
jgi:DNA segregation ATPase FtsK/SpoIIIE, S-DNA-T family